MRFSFLLLLTLIVFSLSAQPFSEENVLIANTGAEQQKDVIFPANFGADKDYFVQFIQNTLTILGQNAEQVSSVDLSVNVIVVIVDVADFNGDGLVDVLTNYGPLYNQGNEVFQDNIAFPSGGSLSGVIHRYVDFDLDGRLDIVSLRDFSGGSLHIYLMNENANTIRETITIDDDDSYETVKITDFDGDNDSDIIYLADMFGGDRLVLLTNDGSNNFTSSNVTTFSAARLLELADLDNDNDLDVINPGRSSRLFYVENADGSLSEYQTLNGSTAVQAFAVGDLDADGNQDVVILDDENFTLYKVLVQFGNGDGTLQEAIQIGTVTGVSPLSVQSFQAFENWISIADVNGDDKPDILVNEFSEENYLVFYNQIEPSSVDEFTAAGITIYPNPVEDRLKIDLPEGSIARVSIYTLEGRLQTSFSNVRNGQSVPVATLRPGFYLLGIEIDGKRINGLQKIQKN